MESRRSSDWPVVMDVEDMEGHKLRIKATSKDNIIVSCTCLGIDQNGNLNPLAVLSIPNGRITEVYKRHVRDVS